MAIYDILSKIKDKREVNNDCMFNGYLEDYLDQIEEDVTQKPFYDLFKMIFDMNDSIKICTDLKLNINKDAIANQIIRYKDSFKLAKGQIKAPYVLYGNFDDVQRAIVLCPGKQEEYILAKALYYVMSEPDNEFEGSRNEVISFNVDMEQMDTTSKIVERFFLKKEKAGIVQRSLDRLMFASYEDMYTLAQKMANETLQHLKEILSKADNKDAAINNIIATWFLLKKFSYVQYMMDKNNLMKLHGGNVKKQRQAAKEKCDAIVFTAYSELWKTAKNL
ncbi:MAG: hypothetical protein RR863_00565 [Erysipelotrichaceae bacterium]